MTIMETSAGLQLPLLKFSVQGQGQKQIKNIQRESDMNKSLYRQGSNSISLVWATIYFESKMKKQDLQAANS